VKKVTFSGRPPAAPAPSPDAWVADRQASREAEPTRRFTFDVPLPLHRRIKAACVQRDRVMAEVIREMLEREFPPA